MEIHHHPQGAEKKKFKEYFLEFVMLFFAVTLGFFTENLRENIVEKRKLYGYMAQMLENMKSDTMRCRSVLTYNKIISRYLDSMRYELENAANSHINGNRLYYLNIITQTVAYVLFKEAAITELKNSGNLRLIEDKNLTNQILEYYDRWIVAADNSYQTVDYYQKELTQTKINFFNWQNFENLIKRDTIFSYSRDTSLNNYVSDILLREPPLLLLNTNSMDLKKLNTQFTQVETSLHIYNSFLRLNLKIADTLIEQIQKQFRLKNDGAQ